MEPVLATPVLYQSRMQFHFVSKLIFLSHQVWFLGNKSTVVFVMSLLFICMDMLECKRGIFLENFK